MLGAQMVAGKIFASRPGATARFPKACNNAKEFPPASKIFVRNLSYSINEARLKTAFSDFGQIAEVKIPIKESTKKPKGYAFVQYSSQDEAVMALENMDGKMINGREVMVEIAKPSRKRISSYPITSGPPKQTPTTDANKSNSINLTRTTSS